MRERERERERGFIESDVVFITWKSREYFGH